MTSPLFPDVLLPAVALALREGEARWRALGVTRVRVFGSVSRGEASHLSDVNLLVDFDPQQTPGLLELVRVREVMEELLGRRVEVVTERALKPPLLGEILEDAVDVLSVPWPPPQRHREKRWRWQLFELLDAIDRISAYTAPLTPTTFLRDESIQDAVLYNLVRLGETTKFIPQSVQDRHPQVPWVYLRDVRNLLAHDYFGIDAGLLWNTVKFELPAVRQSIQALADSPELEKEEGEERGF